jgi:hypothetical protein
MHVLWELDDTGSLAASTPGGHYLLVERLPEKAAWDWVVWRRGAHPRAARHGKAYSAETAMMAAERMVRECGDVG